MLCVGGFFLTFLKDAHRFVLRYALHMLPRPLEKRGHLLGCQLLNASRNSGQRHFLLEQCSRPLHSCCRRLYPYFVYSSALDT